ncbi:IclR family transcriptional regulator [Mycolicibacterium sp. CH28]|uniref:IclR family transcriptional regulator n=1 Tax=Mycolicibacterium sp. CH28 TaxID=2512237 RepID=UPI001F3EF79B|nr:IclR family transcriptional regulator [Mycolicibacterium sp. CH28]
MKPAETPVREDVSDADAPPSILTKAFDLLRAFNFNERVMTLTELAHASGLPKSTVHRLLARLIELGAVEHHRGSYKIGIEIFRLGVTSPVSSMRDAASSHLAALHRQTGQNVHLAVLRQHEVVLLERLSVQRVWSPLFGVGGRLPAQCTALGKAMLAFEDPADLRATLPDPMPRLTATSIKDVAVLLRELAEVRRAGVARQCGQVQPGLACTAVPLMVNGAAVGAISISAVGVGDVDRRHDAALRATGALVEREVFERLTQGRMHWFPKEM